MNSRCDVVLISGSFWPRQGGAERQARVVLGSLVRHGWRCAVVTQALPGEPRRDSIDGIEVYRVGSKLALSRSPRVGMVTAAAASLTQAVALRPRVIWTLMLGSQSLVGAVAARIAGARHVLRLTGGGTQEHRSEPLVRAASPASRLAVQALLRTGPTVVAPARHLLKDLYESFDAEGVSMQVIPNGVTVSEEGVRRRPAVLWYARAGSETSDSVFREVARRLPDVEFCVMGREVEALPANATSLGWVKHPERLMREVTALINTSRTEGSPNAALQAIAAGASVVGFENLGILELMEDYPDHVSVVPQGDAVAMADAIQQVLSAPTAPPVAAVPTPATVVERWRQLFKETR